MEADWKLNWKQIAIEIEADWNWNGSGLETDWKQNRSRLEADYIKKCLKFDVVIK